MSDGNSRGGTGISSVRLARAFGNLNVRPKLMVLHNLFFLVLAASVYFSLIPLFENRVAGAKSREMSLLVRLFSLDGPLTELPGFATYNFREGSAEALKVPEDIRNWLGRNRGDVYIDAQKTESLYRLTPSGLYRRAALPNIYYDSVVDRAKFTIFLVLGVIYALAVLLLELVVMPRYVYGPIRLFLDADDAIHRGDRRTEMIDEKLIPADEIGQIMASRNRTVAELRKQEQELAEALEELERTAADLQLKNEQLEQARQSLVEQDRLASLGLLSASVAHELNTPLSVLQGSIEKLAETVDDSHAQERLARMLRVTQRLKKISESLVDFARVRRPELGTVVMRPVVEEAWSLVAIDEKSSGVTFLNCVDGGEKLSGNADRLVQVFVNLLRNALNALGPGGRILVSSRRYREGGRDWVAFAIEDNGPGIPEDLLPDIFEAFVTTRLDSRGTGLGLTVSEGIVTQHGGTIVASNRAGGGAMLEVRLPAA